MKYLLLVMVSLLCFIDSRAQVNEAENRDSFYSYRRELGVNFTNVLGNVLSLNPNNANSPYNITFRKHGKNFTFRSALSFSFENKKEFTFDGDKELKTNNNQLSAGLQKTEILGSNFALGYGLDLIGAYEYERSNVLNFNGVTFDAIDRVWRIGFGPVLRLEYKLSRRIYFSTESSFYGIYGRRHNEIKESGFPVTRNDTDLWNVRLQLPQSLFVNIAF
ncbi:MAG: hypothetical protein IPM26_04500 [Saprospiraceae bacterium]|nr:hypothetical protein [Saprospiraceae bacterium]